LTESVYGNILVLTESVDKIIEVYTLEKFLSLPEEKQKTIIDAALKCFAANGYKKTSVSDMAAEAGISKSMVFHYFGTKKELYFYLINLCGSTIENEIKEKFDHSVTDFFERIRLSTVIEISVIKKHPATLSFLTSMYFEDDHEVRDDIKAILSQGEGFRNNTIFDGMDFSKFKESVDIKILMKMLSWITDGYANQLKNISETDYDALFEEFDKCLNMLKNNFYKEEYL
jgi:Transcriptional regulator